MGTKTPKQPEALRLAVLLNIGCLSRKDEKAAAKELRRLHGIVQALEDHLFEEAQQKDLHHARPP